MSESDIETIDMQLSLEIEINEVFWDKEGLKAIVDIGYYGAESMDIIHHNIGAGKIMTELVNTKNGGSQGKRTIKIGEKVKIK